MKNIPKQFDVETVLDKNIGHGDKAEIAALCDVSPSAISQQVNPHVELKSWVFQALRFVWAVYCVNPAAGRAITSMCDAYFDSWERETRRGSSDLAELACNIAQQTNEFIQSRLRGCPREVQRKELLDIRAAVDEKLDALDAFDSGAASMFPPRHRRA